MACQICFSYTQNGDFLMRLVFSAGQGRGLLSKIAPFCRGVTFREGAKNGICGMLWAL